MRPVHAAALGCGQSGPLTRVAEPSAAPTRPPEPNESCVHPVVRTHPRTGRESLFVNPLFTRHFEGMSPAESAPLLGELYAVAREGLTETRPGDRRETTTLSIVVNACCSPEKSQRMTHSCTSSNTCSTAARA